MERKYEKRLYEEDIRPPGLGKLVTDKISGKDVSAAQVMDAIAGAGKRTARKYVKGKGDTRYAFDPEYHFIKDVVMTALEPGRYGIRKVSNLGKNLGEHDNRGIRVLEKSSIPGKVFSGRYREVLGRVGKSPDEFNDNVQKYIMIHEIAEREFMHRYGIRRLSDDKHGKFEAYVIKSLENLALEGYGTEDILEAAVAVHSTRKPGDTFLKMTKKYNDKLEDWISRFLNGPGYNSPVNGYGYNSGRDILM